MSINVSARILCVLRCLQEKTDEQHPLSTKQILDYLETQGIHIGLLHYCKLYRRNLPKHYIEIAADNDAYDDYCIKLTTNLIDMASQKIM